jgi:Tol biopolymer transport system component
LTNHPAPWLGVAWSPDGRNIAVHRLATEEPGIFLVPALGGPERKLASTNNSVLFPPWATISSPDGRRVVFTSNRSGINEIWVCDSDGGNAQQLTSLGNSTTGTPRWSSDGKQIVFDSRVGGEANVYVLDANGGVPRKLETGTRMNSEPSWSHVTGGGFISRVV